MDQNESESVGEVTPEPYQAGVAGVAGDTDLSADLDFDFDDEEWDEENGDLLRVLGVAGGVAALVGGLIILLGRKKETPAEHLVHQARDAGKDLRKAVARMELGELLGEARDQANRRVREANLGDLARDAGRSGRALARTVGKTARNFDLEDTIGEIGKRLATIEREGRRGARRAQKEARHALSDLDLSSLPEDVSGSLTDLWENVSKRARDIGWEDALDEAGKEVRQLSRRARKAGGNFDLSGLADMLDNVKEQLAGAGARVGAALPEDVQTRLEDDLLPEARKRARQAAETLSSVAGDARRRGSNLADEYAPTVKKQAARAAAGAGGLGSQVGDMIQVVGLELLNRLISDVLPGAKKGGQQVADTLREDTLPWLRHRAGEARDRVRDDVAPRVREMAAEAPGRVRDAVDTATPIVADTFSSAAGAVGDAVARARPKVADAVDSGRSGVGGAIGNIGHRAGDAVGATVATTKYVTGETSRIVFWMSMLSGLILLAFIPDPEKQKEIWANIQEFFGEMRGMWSDLSDAELEADSQEYTGDAGV